MNELLIQETNSHFSLGKKRKFPFENSKSNPQVLVSEQLNKSLELLSKLEYKIKNEKESYLEKSCEFCQIVFLIKEETPFTCKNCRLVLCRKHRINKNHNCMMKTTAIERYLQSKKVMSCKLKANKYKKIIDNK